MLIALIDFLAQTSQPTVTGQPAQPAPGPMDFLPLIAMFSLVFYFLFWRPQSRDRKKQKDLMEQIKKGDRVMTIGGIIGTVLAVKDNEITLKVDESTNTKMTFIRGAVKTMITPDAGEKKDGKKSA